MRSRVAILLFAVGISSMLAGPAMAQGAEIRQDTVGKPNYPLLHGMFAAQTVLYVGSIYGLSKAWYKDPLTSFRVVDDSNEWKQIDKMGHMYSAYQISRHTAQLYRTTGVSKKQAVLYGAISGFFFQTPIEILDGFSKEYGFSPGDMAANLVGPALFVGQYALWDEIRIQPKYSFHFTPLASARPELLGERRTEQWLKDYNGQTYWFSASPGAFARHSRWPTWLCLSAGYGIQNMVSAETNKSIVLGYQPYRQYYLSLDVDFTKIKTNSKALKTVFFLLNSLKIPAPAIEFSKRGIVVRRLYF